MSLITIDPERCTKDGHCVAECPPKIIELTDDTPFIQADAEERCIDCGHCVAVCPAAALSHENLSAADCPPVIKRLKLTEEQAEQFLRSRRSIRNYKDKPVERATLQRLIDLARHAPTASNAQPVQWLMIEQPAEVQRVSGMVTDWMRDTIITMPEMAAERNFERIVASQEAGEDRICRGAPHLAFAFADNTNLNAGTDCAIALSYMELFLPALGLGGCWGGYVKYAANLWPPLVQYLDLPPQTECYGVMMIGYPIYRYHRLPVRREAPVIWR